MPTLFCVDCYAHNDKPLIVESPDDKLTIKCDRTCDGDGPVTDEDGLRKIRRDKNPKKTTAPV